MAYRNGNRDQITLLPDSVDDYVSHDDPVRAYDAFIDCLDLNALGVSIDSNAVGNSSYHPPLRCSCTAAPYMLVLA